MAELPGGAGRAAVELSIEEEGKADSDTGLDEHDVLPAPGDATGDFGQEAEVGIVVQEDGQPAAKVSLEKICHRHGDRLGEPPPCRQDSIRGHQVRLLVYAGPNADSASSNCIGRCP